MAEQARKVLDRDEVSSVLEGAFYVPQIEARSEDPPPSGTRAKTEGAEARRAKEDKETLHYKVICISLYNEDLARLDQMVDELKSRGFTKANRSALIRTALDQVDLSKIRRGM